MRTKISYLFCLAAALFILDSCTITKRHFEGGYHVEWKKKWNESTADLQSPRMQEAENSTKIQTEETDTLHAQTTPVYKSDSKENTSKEKESKQVEKEKIAVFENHLEQEENASLTQNQVEVVTPSQSVLSDQPVLNESTDQSRVQTNDSDEEASTAYMKKRPKVEKLTWVALGFLIAAIVLALMPASIMSFTLFSVLFALLMLAAFINAVSSAIRVKRFPDHYKAKGLTWLVLVLCSIGFVYALVQLILVAFVPGF